LLVSTMEQTFSSSNDSFSDLPELVDGGIAAATSAPSYESFHTPGEIADSASRCGAILRDGLSAAVSDTVRFGTLSRFDVTVSDPPTRPIDKWTVQQPVKFTHDYRGFHVEHSLHHCFIPDIIAASLRALDGFSPVVKHHATNLLGLPELDAVLSARGTESMFRLLSRTKLFTWLRSWGDTFRVWVKKSKGWNERVQQWVAVNIAPGISLIDSAGIFEKLVDHMTFLFPCGVDIWFASLDPYRVSVDRTMQHYRSHGNECYDDSFKLSESVVGYNAFRSNIHYPCDGSWKQFMSNYTLCSSPVWRAGHTIDTPAELINFRRVGTVLIGGLPRPHEVMNLCFNDSQFDEGIRRFKDPKYNSPDARNVYECIRNPQVLSAWFEEIKEGSWCIVQVEEPVRECVSRIMEYCHRSSEEGAQVTDALCTVALCVQWFADVICAHMGSFWRNPYESRICAAHALYFGVVQFTNGHIGRRVVVVAKLANEFDSNPDWRDD